MKLKCPWCGTRGTDRKPVPEHLRGPSWTPSSDEDDYAFEVRGNLHGRPVRKCLGCGQGVRVTVVPPRFRKIPEDQFERFQEAWERYRAEEDQRMRALFANRSPVEARQPEHAEDDTDELLRRLQEDVEAELPSDNGEPEPTTRIIALTSTPDAPIIAVSRDPRSGPMLTPVFFAAAKDEATLDELVAGLLRDVSAQAPVFHAMGSGEHLFLMVPLMFHLVDADEFLAHIDAYLGRWEERGVVFEDEDCEVRITHRGMSHTAIETSDKTRLFEIRSTPIDQ